MNIKSKNIKKSLISIGKDITINLPVLLDPKIIDNPLDTIVKFFQNVSTSMISRFLNEYRDRKNKGEVKSESFLTDKPESSFIDLIKFIGQEIPDEDRIKALKSIFFYGVSKNAIEQDEVLAFEFLQTAKKLSSTEVLILKANFELVLGKFTSDGLKENLGNAQSKRSAWKKIIASQMGYGEIHDIVTKYESNLESLGLISPRYENTSFSDEFESTQKYRLTGMGYKFCEFMTKYN